VSAIIKRSQGSVVHFVAVGQEEYHRLIDYWYVPRYKDRDGWSYPVSIRIVEDSTGDEILELRWLEAFTDSGIYIDRVSLKSFVNREPAAST
jgi:hypothetical protein